MNNKDDNAVENSIVAVATVIQVQAPTSAKPGDKAFIRANGVIDGWVGGGCVQPAVNAISREVLNSGQPCLLRVAPDGKWQPVEGVTDYASSCLGKGTVLLFLEPLRAQPNLCVLGDSAVARSLVEQAIHMSFNVSLHTENPQLELASKAVDVRTSYECLNADFVVIATQGKGDRKAIAAALRSRCPHIRMVVSARKLEALKFQLHAGGEEESVLDRLCGPAGIDINAQLPQEIALSVLAEIVKLRRADQAVTNDVTGVVSEATVSVKPADVRPGAEGCCE